MFFITSKIIGFFLSPIIWILILLTASFFFQKKRKSLIIICFAIFCFFTNGFIYDEFARSWQMKNKISSKQTYDVGIVLGGMADYDKETDQLNFNKHADRLFSAEYLYRKGKIRKIMIVGGNGFLFPNSYIESEQIKKHLLIKGIPDENIFIENRSRNTKENAFFSSLILKEEFPKGEFLLITSSIHMKRALLCFQEAGIVSDYYATDLVKENRVLHLNYILIPRANTLVLWEELIHEWIGYIAYKLVL